MRRIFVAAMGATFALAACGSDPEVATEREDAVVEGEAADGDVIGEEESEREGAAEEREGD